MISPFCCPVYCTAGFPTYPSGKPHSGEDYVPYDRYIESNWNLFSPLDGVVVVSKKQNGSYRNGYGAYGNYLVISGRNQYEGYHVLMAHLDCLPVVKKGDRVFAGQFLGIAGSTGNVTGRHLHIEVCKSVRDLPGDWYSYFTDHLIEPSSVIDFAKYGDDTISVWKNGSTKEKVYPSSRLCRLQASGAIGTINPYEECICYGTLHGCYIVGYKVDNQDYYKVGLVLYPGGVKL